MIEIHKEPDGRFRLFCDGEPLSAAFSKIEKVTDNSNYYCLWKEDGFYLYHAKKNFYALRTNIPEKAQMFSTVKYYSEKSQSFVACRSINVDKVYAYIVYEDGYVTDITDPFREVGEESNGMRPVKSCDNKWVYYDTMQRRLVWRRDKGYRWKQGEWLGRKLGGNCFVKHSPDGRCQLGYYDPNEHQVHYEPSAFDSIEELGKNCLIGKLDSNNSYALYTLPVNGNPHLVGLYDQKPIYDEKLDIFIARKRKEYKEEWYVITPKRKEVTSFRWQENNFVIEGEYIFNQSEGKWRIFNMKDGSEAPVCWKNLRVFNDDGFRMLADTAQGVDQEVFIADIKKQYEEALRRTRRLYEERHSPASVKQQELAREKEDASSEVAQKPAKNVEQVSIRKQAETAFECENRLPDKISYYTYIDNAHISRDGYLYCGRKCANISKGKYICWLIRKNKALAVTEYLRPSTYKLCYYKVLKDECALFEIQEKQNRFVAMALEDVQEDTLVGKLQEIILNNRSGADGLLQKQRVKEFLLAEDFDPERVEVALSVLYLR